MAPVAGSIFGLVATDRADLFANGRNIIVDVVTVSGLNGASDFREQTEKGAGIRLFEAALPLDGPIRANAAYLISNYGFQFEK